MDLAQFTVVHIGALSRNKFWGETERGRRATATCTLLGVNGKWLLVDPSPDPEPLQARLFETTGLKPEAIDMVFVTHWHGDHRYGLALFPGKPWLMAQASIDEWRERVPDDEPVRAQFQAAEGNLPAEVALVATPGHTFGHHSLEVDTAWGRLLVAGDSVMTPEFLAAEEGFENSLDFDLAAQTIRMIKSRADLVVPGHGNYVINRR